MTLIWQIFADSICVNPFNLCHPRSILNFSEVSKKLILLNSIEHESDLIVPYSNHFEHLKGDRKSECSIRINDQWRICFRFENGNVYDAGIEDYH